MYNDLMSVCLRWKTLAYCELNKGSGVRNGEKSNFSSCKLSSKYSR